MKAMYKTNDEIWSAPLSTTTSPTSIRRRFDSMKQQLPKKRANDEKRALMESTAFSLRSLVASATWLP